ncbi:MAG: FAD binding domain-containing protein [Rhodobacteraceae bacterium]|nr:FAD binding domain-containing protein [Paracoccaceae bacterium]
MNTGMNFELNAPASIAEVVEQLANKTGARVFSGGTDLVPNLRRRIGTPPVLVSTDGVAEMKSVDLQGDHLVIGAAMPLAQLLESDKLAGFPALLQAIAEVAGPGLREAATIGGNLCQDTRCLFYNQSHWWRKSNGFCLKLDGDTCHVAPNGEHCFAAYCGDVAPALLVLGAEVRIAAQGKDRWVSLNSIYEDDGRSHLLLKPGELLVSIRIPLKAAQWRSGYLKSRLRKSVDFPLAGVAVALRLDNRGISHLRIAVTGTNSRPLLFEDFSVVPLSITDDLALSAIDREIGQSIKPMRTTNLPGLYRRKMVAVLGRRLIEGLTAPTGKNGV